MVFIVNSWNAIIMKRLAKIDKTLLSHDAALQDLHRQFLPSLQPSPLPPKKRIGCLRENET